jgi:hypothetical protein
MLVQRIRDLGQSRPVLDLFQQFGRDEILDAAGRRIAERLEQPRRNQNPN